MLKLSTMGVSDGIYTLVEINNQTGAQKMDYRESKFLQDQIDSIISFYHPICIDKKYGGYIAIVELRRKIS